MDAMTVVADDRRWTRARRDALPDDGIRRELLDGALVMTPAPAPRHQGVVGELFVLLHAACPAGLRVLMAPVDVTLDDRTVLQPDLVVVTADAIGPNDVTGPPLLAVEVLSPGTRLVDLNRKRPRLERAGCAAFWPIDPDEPSLLAWELRASRYVVVAHPVGEQEWVASLPFPVAIRPATLIR